MRPRAVCAILAIAAGAACMVSASDPATLRTELMERDRAFNRATQERGADAWPEYFADDGAMIRAGEGEIRGAHTIHQAIAATLADGKASLTWEPIRADASAGGDLGYTVGSYVYRGPGPEGTPAEQRGLYVTIWKKDRAGRWKIVMDLGNPTDGT